jgi:hypothetical protein
MQTGQSLQDQTWSILHPWEQPKECAGIRNLGGDRAGVQLTAEQIEGAGVSADSHSNLHGNVFLYDEIAEIDDIAELAEVEEPHEAPVMPVMSVTPSTHSVEFRIDQFTHFTHEFPPRGFACEQHKASQCLTVFDIGGWFFHL